MVLLDRRKDFPPPTAPASAALPLPRVPAPLHPQRLRPLTYAPAVRAATSRLITLTWSTSTPEGRKFPRNCLVPGKRPELGARLHRAER